MKSHALRSAGLFLMAGLLLFPLTVMGESLSEYTTRVEKELEIPLNSIKGFNCEGAGSVVLPTSEFGAACDAQALLPGVDCIANSRFGVQSFSNPDVKGVWVCRKYASVDLPDNGKFNDIAMIVHNRKNGRTAFFQNHLYYDVARSQGPDIPGPKDGNASDVWRQPQGVVSAAVCTSCHLNDAFIVTPHVAKAFDIFGMTRFNPNGPYSVVASDPGQDFASFKSPIIKVMGCGGMCHSNPKQDFTNDALSSKTWMPPGHRENYTPYNFNPIGGQFYALRDTGEVQGLNGPSGGGCNDGKCPHWSILGDNPNTAEIAASFGKVYSRETSGKIREFTGPQCSANTDPNSSVDSCPDWKLLENNANTAQIVSGAGKVYQLRNDGSIWRHTGTPCIQFHLPFGGNPTICLGWEKLDNNSQTIEIVASDIQLYQRHKDGTVWKFTNTPCSGNSCPGWQLIASDPRTIDLVAGGSALYMFQQLGAIWKFTGTPCSGNSCPGWQLVAPNNNGDTKQVAAGSGELYRLHKNGEIWRYTGRDQNWIKLDSFSGNVEIAASSNGLLVRHAAGDVWRFTPIGWIQIQNLTNTIALTGARP